MKLNDSPGEIFRLNDHQKNAVKKLGLKTVGDLLYHFPTRYGDTSSIKNIESLVAGETAVIFGRISRLKTSKGFRTKIPMADGTIEDESGTIKAVWFNQPYLAKMLKDDSFVRAEGRVSVRKKTGELYLSNPKIEKVEKLPTGVGDSLFGEGGEPHALYPVYPESRGITSNWIYHTIQKVFKSGILDSLSDPIPTEILDRYHLPHLKTAVVWIHAPKKESDAIAARKRFAFEEVFFIQLERQKIKRQFQKNKAPVIEVGPATLTRFTSRFPFRATGAQTRGISDILRDITEGRPMGRLLEGDVGSGKTFVAAAATYATVMTKPENSKVGSLQVAYMAPTEILASQHFESFISYFKHLPINVALITGSGCRKFPSKVNPAGWTDISRSQLLKWVANGEIPILIGTHALIQKAVKFKNLGMVIIDEQHRFGTAQRQKLARKDGLYPHLLSMTATPIPRTLALTIFGDLDLTVLDEMPEGRKAIITEIVLPGQRDSVYEKIRTELKAGRQAYIICPRIDEPDPNKEMAILAKSVKEEAKRLKKSVFPEFEIDIVHSKLKDDDKEKVMNRFKSGEVDILVATSVVEVGVNVPNATSIIIEGAERFGLAQLHQLRGRVLRSNHQAYCYVFAETKSKKSLERLKALQSAASGFDLAEWDLKLRGPGELSGNKQWGISDIGMEALKNIKMVEAARFEAKNILEKDETLKKYPLVAAELEKRKKEEIHFE
ncbi:MAG TPA: ATP-dependent DNA helicase RecG [Candidatus Paceibacterota bacterium]